MTSALLQTANTSEDTPTTGGFDPVPLRIPLSGRLPLYTTTRSKIKGAHHALRVTIAVVSSCDAYVSIHLLYYSIFHVVCIDNWQRNSTSCFNQPVKSLYCELIGIRPCDSTCISLVDSMYDCAACLIHVSKQHENICTAHMKWSMLMHDYYAML